MKTTECSCGNFGCAKRIARGLAPFCSGEVSATDRRADDAKAGIFTSYSAAVAASPVGKAKWIGGGGTSGGPARFKAVA